VKYFIFLMLAGVVVFSDPGETPADAHYMSGLAYYRSGDAAKARVEFQKAIEVEKQHTGSAKMLQVLDSEAFTADPADPFNGVIKEYFEKGLEHFRRGEKDKALQEWERALKISPSNKQLLCFCGLASTSVEKKENPVIAGKISAKIEEKAGSGDNEPKKQKQVNSGTEPKNKIDEKKVSDLYYEGLKAYKLGDLRKAIKIWEQVLLLDPGLSKARRNLENAKKQLVQGEQK